MIHPEPTAGAPLDLFHPPVPQTFLRSLSLLRRVRSAPQWLRPHLRHQELAPLSLFTRQTREATRRCPCPCHARRHPTRVCTSSSVAHRTVHPLPLIYQPLRLLPLRGLVRSNPSSPLSMTDSLQNPRAPAHLSAEVIQFVS